MVQDNYRALVDQEFDETWDAEEYDDATKLAWRCDCARAVLSRLGTVEAAELDKARGEFQSARLEEWEKANVVEGGALSEDALEL